MTTRDATDQPGPEVLAETAERLRVVLATIEAGELPAEADQVVWLKGALAVLELLVGQPTEDVSLPWK